MCIFQFRRRKESEARRIALSEKIGTDLLHLFVHLFGIGVHRHISHVPQTGLHINRPGKNVRDHRHCNGFTARISRSSIASSSNSKVRRFWAISHRTCIYFGRIG